MSPVDTHLRWHRTLRGLLSGALSLIYKYFGDTEDIHTEAICIQPYSSEVINE